MSASSALPVKASPRRSASRAQSAAVTVEETLPEVTAPTIDSPTQEALEEAFIREKPRTTLDDAFDADSLVAGTFKRWSASAVACYIRQANCTGCYYQKFFSDRPYDCKMHLAVDQLLESIGEPTPTMMARCI